MSSHVQSAQSEEERAYYALNRKVYPTFSHFYNLVVLPIGYLRHEIASMLPVSRGARILDVATGTGAQARAFAERGAEVIGVDISEAMLRVAKRKRALPNLRFVHADATALPFGDSSFDASCISFALHEMPLSVRAKVLREMVRVTKRGGAIVVVDYALPGNSWARSVVFQAVKLYERDSYAEFVHSDVPALLTDAGIELKEQRSALVGAARIYLGQRREVRDAVELQTSHEA